MSVVLIALLAMLLQVGLSFISTKQGYGYGRGSQIAAVFLNGLLVARVISLHGSSLSILLIALIISILISTIFVDYKHYIIPDGYNLTIFIAGVVFVIIHHDHWISLLSGSGILVLMFLVLLVISGGRLGMGDVKMVVGLGLILGMSGLMQYLLVSFLTASLLSVFLLLFKFKKVNDVIPFGPFLAVGFIYIFVGL